MNKLLGCLAALPISFALVVACGGSDDDAPPDDGSSSGILPETGTSSGTSGTSGASGTSGTSGGDGSTTDAPTVIPPKPCDPSKTECKVGELCTNVGPDPAYVCRAGCKNDGECTGTPKTGCVIVVAGTPPQGACIPTCKPYGTECAAGTTCSKVPEVTGTTQTSKAAYCRKTGTTPLKMSCVNDPGACGANAECLFFPDIGEGVNDSKCHTLCDGAHPCGANQGFCVIQTGYTFGFCNGG